MAKKLVVEIIGDSSSLDRAFRNATKSGGRLGGSLKTLGKVAAVGVGAAFAGLAVVVKNGFEEIAEGQKVASDTAAILKSTGGIANVTAKEVEGLAEAQSKLTGVDDELIQASENLLLTFKNVRNEVGKGNDIFNRATAAGLDLAQVGFGTPESAAKMLGKALNDPVKGMSALGRAGVTFSEAQKEVIKDLVKSGDLLGAQKIILKEVESQVGGAAKAYGETFPGQVNKLRNAFDEMSGRIATELLPIFEQLVAWTVEHMPQIEAAVTGVVKGIAATINFLVPIIQTVIEWFRQLAAFVRKHWDEVQAAAQRVVAWYQGTLAPAINNVLTAIRAFWDRFGADIVRVIQLALGQILTVVRTVMGNIASVINIILAVLRGDWGKAWSEFKEIPRRSLAAIVALLRGMVGIFATVARALGAAIIAGITAGLSALAGKVAAELGKIGAAIRGVAGQAAGWAAEIGQAIVRGIVSGMGGLFSSVKDKIIGGVQGAIDGAMGLFGNSPQEVIGIALVDGIVRGWNAQVAKGGLKTKMVDDVNKAIDAAQAAVIEKRDAFGEAFSGLISNALGAFDAVVAAWKPPASRLLEAFDAKQAAEELKKRVDELKGALLVARTELQQVLAAGPEVVERQEGESDEAFNQRQLDAQRAFLEKKAAAEAAAATAFLALQEEQRNQQLAKERAALEKRAAEQQKKHDQQKERERVLFESSLTKLQNAYLKQELTTEQFHTRLIALFKKFEVPFGKATARLGFALAHGLRESFNDVHKAARALAQEVLAAFEGITIRIRTELQHTDSPHRQHGGPVRAGSSYVVGEAGPELFVPNTSGRIVPNGATGTLAGGVIVNVYGDVTGDEIVERVRQGLLRINQFNPGNPVAR